MEQSSRDGRNRAGDEVGVAGVHGGWVNKEAMLSTRPLLIIYEDFWSSVNCTETLNLCYLL